MKTIKRSSRDCATCMAEKRPQHCRIQTVQPPASTRSMKFSLIGVLFICLIIISTFQVSEARPAGRKRKKPVKETSENEIMVDEPGSRGGRRSRNRHANMHKVLNTSEEALNVTERRYLKKDWCRKRPLKQFIRLKNGCSGYFLNNFCYGQCNSFYIPRELTPKAKEQEAFKSCAYCKPSRVVKVPVTLTCPPRKGSKRARTIRKMVNKIQDCRCITVPNIDSRTPAPGRSL